MNKELLLTVLIVLTVALSVSTIYASDVNITDSYSSCENDTYEISVYDSSVDNDSSNDNILESDNSDTLSTDEDSNSLQLSDDNAEILSATNTTIDKSKTITSKDITKYYKGSTKYTATFYDSYGNLLKNKNVKIKVKGVTYTKKTNSKGVASIAINQKPGSYKVVATNPVTGYSKTTTFKILSTISAKDLTKIYTDTKKFSATFYKSNGKVLANKNVRFKINGKTYTKKTNSKGVATLSLTSLTKGIYKIVCYNTDGLTKTKQVKVVTYATTSLTASSYTFLKSDSKTIKVRLLHKLGYAPGKGKVITFKVNGKTYTSKTDSKGYAKLKLPSLSAGVYTITYKFAGNSFYKASSTKSKVTIIPSKTPKLTVKSTTNFGHLAGTAFKVALTSGSVPIAGKTVTFKVNNKTYSKTTDSKGIASLKINKLAVGNYTISYTNKADSKINSKTGSTKITVFERPKTSVTWKSSASMYQGTRSVKVLLLNSKGKAISGATVKLTVNSKTYSAKTSSSGYATFSISLPSAGTKTIKYSYAGSNSNAPSSGSKKVTVLKVTKISFSNILTASSNLKKYFENNNKLPSTVTAGGIKFTVPEFLYLMSKAIQEMGSSSKKDITIVYGVSKPSSPSGNTINGKELMKSKYIAAAKSVANYISKNKKAPNYVSTAVGKIHYKEIVDAFSRILTYYKNNKAQPNYVTINYPTSAVVTSQSGSGLNEKNTIKTLTAYLKSSTNCQVGNAAIKKIVNSLTKGLTSDSAKAKAIYNYVRDKISYSFYYDTKHGAKGTLSAKSGNCVDQAHLVIAMFRTAGLPARYVHGTCTFSSGSTYGHVWAQVLIGGKWTVADATSSRNSLGNVVNWNTKSYSVHGIYSGISF